MKGYSVVRENRTTEIRVGRRKKYETDTANADTVFLIIQSIPSPKAEPFKRCLAKVGYERVQEIEDPERARSTRLKDIRYC